MARYRKHTITRDDTIQSIAQRYTGDVSYWRSLVDYNKLRYPYIVYSTAEKKARPEDVLTLGDTILIPLEQSLLDVDTSTLGNRDRDLIMALSLGSDLSLLGGDERYKSNGTRDEVFELSGDGRGDIAVATGIENIRQAVIARLLTKRGSLLLHPNYGSEIHSLVGEPANTLTQELIDNEILRTLKKDGRVSNATKEYSRIQEDVYTGEFIVEIYSIDEMFRLLIEAGEEGLNII